jgi:arsenate reductase-like glutaredoxin family protein
MEITFFHLGTCNTCQRILKSLPNHSKLLLQDIKTEPISAKQLDAMAALAGSYEALFSKRARQYRAKGLHEKELTEKEYRQLILEEYTFLKRPVLLLPNVVIAGNSKKAIQEMITALSK